MKRLICPALLVFLASVQLSFASQSIPDQYPGSELYSKPVEVIPQVWSAIGARSEIYKRRFNSDLAPILEKAARLVEEKKGSTLLDLPGFIYCPAGKASAKSIVSYYGDEPRRMTTTPSPVLIIAASKDTVVPDVVEKFTPVTDGKKVRLQVIEDASHLFLDFYAEDAADLIAAFLGE